MKNGSYLSMQQKTLLTETGFPPRFSRTSAGFSEWNIFIGFLLSLLKSYKMFN